MNERIRLLAGQALDKAIPYTWTNLDYYEIEKLQEYFAKLLIGECCHKLENDGMVEVAMEIKEHFGVNE